LNIRNCVLRNVRFGNDGLDMRQAPGLYRTDAEKLTAGAHRLIRSPITGGDQAVSRLLNSPITDGDQMVDHLIKETKIMTRPSPEREVHR
jgi:hypothetical protein